MHPIDHYETLRRGREELLRRAEYERMARKAMAGQRKKNRTIQMAADWLGFCLVNLGAKLEQFGAFGKRQPTPTTTKRVDIRPLSKISPHH
jgi:hypothetical protein